VKNIDALQNVTSENLSITFIENFELTTIDGLIGLPSVNYLTLKFNYNLEHLDGLLNVTSINSGLTLR